MILVEVYGKRDCCLCDEAKATGDSPSSFRWTRRPCAAGSATSEREPAEHGSRVDKMSDPAGAQSPIPPVCQVRPEPGYGAPLEPLDFPSITGLHLSAQLLLAFSVELKRSQEE